MEDLGLWGVFRLRQDLEHRVQGHREDWVLRENKVLREDMGIRVDLGVRNLHLWLFTLRLGAEKKAWDIELNSVVG